MANGFVVHASLLAFNFFTSIIQCTTGFGDAIVLQVLWFIATEVAPHIFNETSLGDSPVKAATLLIYCRVTILTPALAYLSFCDGIFSPQLTTLMAVPSTLTALVGLFVFSKASGDHLEMVLGVSSLIFATLYAALLASKHELCKRMVQRLRGNSWNSARPTHLTRLGITPESTKAETNLNPIHGKRVRGKTTFLASSAKVDNTAGITFVSTTTEPPFTYREATPQLLADSVRSASQRPLTPSEVRPTSTGLVAWSRITCNPTEDDKIKISTKVSASCAAAVSGMMGSLTGVAAPAHIIFIAFLDVPAYVMHVNLIMQSIPSAVLRFIFACSTAVFKLDMAPLFFTSVVGGYAGLMAGVLLGRVLGPESHSVFVLALLLLVSLVTITHSGPILISLSVGCAIVTAVAAVNERQKAAIEVGVRQAMEEEWEARRAKANVLPDNIALPSLVRTPVTNLCTSPLIRARLGESGNRGSAHSTTLSDHRSNPALSCSGQSSTWVRRADLMRPPPLWDDHGNPIQQLFPATGRKMDPAQPPPAPCVSSVAMHMLSATETEKTATVTTLPSSGQRDMCTEEAKRSAPSQSEELLYWSHYDLR
ncbi:hypothetical protein JKF63_02178 [Porcisia hertigi]|uniref:Uncharacterized protein n=1 Tax=Porcisia hertigi TaxID=2761500 RepID=A0A836L5A4_9TRYP|nr:hypothetical protein JKF63_02178 [Porcisia hertigi]